MLSSLDDMRFEEEIVKKYNENNGEGRREAAGKFYPLCQPSLRYTAEAVPNANNQRQLPGLRLRPSSIIHPGRWLSKFWYHIRHVRSISQGKYLVSCFNEMIFFSQSRPKKFTPRDSRQTVTGKKNTKQNAAENAAWEITTGLHWAAS